jgi:deoxycytidylate deaminase
MKDYEADDLIKRDEDEDLEYGQNVTDTFHLSDFFVRMEADKEELKHNLWRFAEVLFGHPYKTPTFDEYAMFLAFVSAMRSSSMSRQVGAVIAQNKEIIATGANDCPQFGGGLYWPEYDEVSHSIKDKEKGRDYTLGLDVNKAEQKQIIDQIITDASEKGVDANVLREVLEDSRIRDLTEFGRRV